MFDAYNILNNKYAFQKLKLKYFNFNKLKIKCTHLFLNSDSSYD